MNSRGFIGRKAELEFLESILHGRALRTCAIFGRRRIGKSTLIEAFCMGKRSICIEFIQTSESDNLDILSKMMSVAIGAPRQYSDLNQALDDISAYCKEAPTVVAFDEYPYLVDTTPGASDRLKLFIDQGLSNSDSMLIVCGSSISKLQEEISDESRPLYGRFIRQIELSPMTYSECAEFHPNMSDIDRVMLYLTLGGIPEYHAMAQWDSYRECVSRLFLGNLAMLSREVENIVNKELSPAGKHIAVLNAIAGGATSLKEISSRAGFNEASCIMYIRNLMSIRLIEKVHPMIGAPKGPKYRISDNVAAFRYEVMGSYSASLGTRVESVFNELEPAIRTFLGRRFESMCMEYIRQNYVCKEIGQWWGRVDGEHVDIDIIASILNDGIKYTLFAECKFRKKAMGFGAYNDLIRRSAAVKGNSNDIYMLFSISGFESELADYAEENGVLLVDMDTLIGSNDPPRIRRVRRNRRGS